ncbi:MAG: hypothetical protein KA156_07735 [Paracoccus sp.]|nr:hypothetical protein [Paracoccus sp. (in: a-proteobacteria)]
MNLTLEDIFALLPAHMRLADATEGAAVRGRIAPTDPRMPEDFGPLRTLASLIARETQVTNEALDDLYDNAFIETCAPWVVPYLGDLLGVRGLQDIPDGLDLRARVADALALRARKGTLRALEHAASEASNLPVMAVEYARRLVHAQSMRLTHPAMGAAVDFRDKPGLARIGMAFERASRGVEVRRIDSPARGRWNLGNVGLQVWRLRPWAISNHQVNPAASGRRIFRFHPLGCDAQLFDRAQARPPIGQPMRESALPIAITRALMAEDPGRFYGENRAIRVFVGGKPLPLAEIRAAHLGDRTAAGTEPWNRAPLPALTLIDPELGRLVIGQNRSGPVRITCHFARALEIGGGEQTRAAAIGSVEGGITIPPSVTIATRIAENGSAGTFLLDQSTHYRMGDAIVVPDDGLLRIVASEGHFPTVAIPGTLTVTLGRNARLELNGLRLHGGGVIANGNASVPGTVILRDCTLVPGLSLGRDGNAVSPGAVSIQIGTPGMALICDRVITGPVRLLSDAEAGFSDCIIDAGDSADPALFAPAASVRHVVSLTRCTVRGQVATGSFTGSVTAGEAQADGLPATSDTLFLGRPPGIEATHRQTGCIRFSLVPMGALVPRLYRCPRGPAPVMTSLRYADPGYMLLAPGASDALRRGAEDGGEIGACNRAALTVRADNIARSNQDFLRFGHAAGVFQQN